MRATIKRHLSLGPGGFKCPCCFPPRGSKYRALMIRQAKRREAREAMRVELSDPGPSV